MSEKQTHAVRIIERLAQHRQRATYGALGDLVGLPARSVMRGLPKDDHNAWIVSKATGLPTGYTTAGRMGDWQHTSPEVLDAADALRRWLATHGR